MIFLIDQTSYLLFAPFSKKMVLLSEKGGGPKNSSPPLITPKINNETVSFYRGSFTSGSFFTPYPTTTIALLGIAPE